MPRAIGAVNGLLMLATLASAVALYAIKHDTRQLEVRVLAQERTLERAHTDVTVLTAERAYLSRPARLEVLARAIGMSPITAEQYLRLDTNSRHAVSSPLVGEGQGGGDGRTSDVGIPPTPNPRNANAPGGPASQPFRGR
jgi:cell division protein FtsL